MLSEITTGNAVTDGRDFNFWFVGQIDQWCRNRNIPFDSERFGLRRSDAIEIKWGIYTKGEERTEWAPCTDMTAMSILIRGKFSFLFRDPHDHSRQKKVLLQDQGDYTLWHESVEHTWNMEQDSVILTLRWRDTAGP